MRNTYLLCGDADWASDKKLKVVKESSVVTKSSLAGWACLSYSHLTLALFELDQDK